MRNITLILLVLHTFTAEAGLRDTWKDFCRRHVVADAPWQVNELHEARLRDLRRRHPEPQDFIEVLVKQYRTQGGLVNRLRVRQDSLSAYQIAELKDHRDYLTWLGLTMREMLPQARGENADKIFRALLDYEDFEFQKGADVLY